jgi:DNA modification methylase
VSYAQARLWDEPEHPRVPTPIMPRRKPVRKIQPTIRNIPGLTATMLVGDVLTVLPTLADESVHTVVTSPPYYGLRDYGTALWEGGDAACDHKARPMHGSVATSTLGPKRDGLGADNQAWRATEPQYGSVCGKCGATRIDSQIGLEATPEAYIEAMVKVFREVRRVMRKDGTLWLNIGDSYAGSGKGPTGFNGIGDQEKRQGFVAPKKDGYATPFRTGGQYIDHVADPRKNGSIPGLKAKDLIGIPWTLAFALRADGWYLRSDIIWSKPNPMPESVTDRPTKAHEYLFLLTKNAKYFYDADAIREEHTRGYDGPGGGMQRFAVHGEAAHKGLLESVHNPAGRNKRSVWQIATAPFPKAHFATFPPKLVEPCIRAGTSDKGCCPECGAPWVRVTGATKYKPAVVAVGARNVDMSRGDKVRKLDGKSAGWRDAAASRITTGWRPSCKHAEFEQVDCETCDGTGDVESASNEGDEEWDDCMACKGKGTIRRLVSAPEPVPCMVLDPFAGAATTLMVAAREGRHSIGIELSETYAEMARERLREDKLSNVEVQ